jgi:hypothetical protein
VLIISRKKNIKRVQKWLWGINGATKKMDKAAKKRDAAKGSELLKRAFAEPGERNYHFFKEQMDNV